MAAAGLEARFVQGRRYTDDDGLADGQEDVNRNGRLDEGEVMQPYGDAVAVRSIRAGRADTHRRRRGNDRSRWRLALLDRARLLPLNQSARRLQE